MSRYNFRQICLPSREIFMELGEGELQFQKIAINRNPFCTMGYQWAIYPDERDGRSPPVVWWVTPGLFELLLLPSGTRRTRIDFEPDEPGQPGMKARTCGSRESVGLCKCMICKLAQKFKLCWLPSVSVMSSRQLKRWLVAAGLWPHANISHGGPSAMNVNADVWSRGEQRLQGKGEHSGEAVSRPDT